MCNLLKILIIFQVKDLVINVMLSNSTHKLLKINNIGLNIIVDCIPNYNSECILDIGL